MITHKSLVTSLILSSRASGTQISGRSGQGFIGYGISLYDPTCASACASVVPTTVNCPHNGNTAPDPSPQCLGRSEPYLISMAWCIHLHCGDQLGQEKIEPWWRLNIPAGQAHKTRPEMTYQQALALVDEPPTETLKSGAVLTQAVSVSKQSYINEYNQEWVYEKVESNSSKYGLIIFTTGCIAPILLSFIRLLPVSPMLMAWVNAWFIDPPVLGRRHAVPLLNAGIVPTRGQAFFIGYLVTINIILSALGYHIAEPTTSYPNLSYQTVSYISNRLGVLSFANLPLLILYSGRNNILLWMTGWSRATFLLIHRWIAFICTLQACLHSIIYLGLVIWEHDHVVKSHLSFWYWGIVAILAMFLVFPFSIIRLRKVAYEAFLVIHIAFAISAIVGSWYHIKYRYTSPRGHETWLYMAIAIWGFDRCMRLLRISRIGLKRAFVTEVDDNYLRVHIPNVHCREHGYFSFPSLTWRCWESHPFSVISQASNHAPEVGVQPMQNTSYEKESRPTFSSQSTALNAEEPSLTLYIGRHAGMTALLAAKANLSTGIPVLIEPSNAQCLDFRSLSRPTTAYPNTICIAGGVGITAILPYLVDPTPTQRVSGRIKLYWASRSQALVDSIRSEVGARWNHVDMHISVSQRHDIKGILETELFHKEDLGTTIRVCGPPSMSDEVRYHVAAFGRHGRKVRLANESFSW